MIDPSAHFSSPSLALEHPGRPLANHLRPLRSLIRSARVVYLRARYNGAFEVGRNSWFGAGAVLAAPDFIHIGDDVAIGRDFHVEANLRIGDAVLVSSRVAIVGNDHRFDDTRENVFWAGRLPSPTVVLEGDNLLGFGTTIIGPAKIGRGCIVGAGSVVTGDLPADSVCVGVPAQPARNRRRA